MRARLIALTIVVVSWAGVLVVPAHADVRWLCRPGLVPNPCEGDQTTTYYEADGTTRVERPPVPADPPVDCFYVYPTVSNQPAPNATQTAEPEQRSIATFQAQRFSTRCKVYAPLYRQVTALGVTLIGQTRDTSGYEVGYQDVREAWLRYLREDNRGRGVVLVGHSQGSRMLRALIRREIDPDPAARSRLVAAIIPGANHVVLKGSDRGGDFANVGLCTRPGQPGCVMSWHSFNEQPPDNARFGRADTDPTRGALDLPMGDQYEVACTDPAALAGDAGRLDTLVPSEPFAPGVIALLLLVLYGGPPPSAPTPWLQPADRYTGRCERVNGAHVLMIAGIGEAKRLTPVPDRTWGVHLVDVNLPLGNVLRNLDAQIAAFTRADSPLRVALRTVGRRKGARLLAATVTGPAGAVVRVTLRRKRAVVARRIVTLRGGEATVRFRVRRPGPYHAVVRRQG